MKLLPLWFPSLLKTIPNDQINIQLQSMCLAPCPQYIVQSLAPVQESKATSLKHFATYYVVVYQAGQKINLFVLQNITTNSFHD